MHFGAKEMTNSDLEAAHRKVLEHLAVKLTEGTTMVLKGGTALFLRYGLDRFSTDLDFDSGKKFSLEQRIKAAFKDLGTVENFSTPKDTETVTRHKCEYEVDGVRGRLKLEVSHRGTAEDENIRLLDGIRTYNVAELLKQKLAAIKGRTAPRDLYDVAFLTGKFPEECANERQRLEEVTENVDHLLSRYAIAWSDDAILEKAECEETILKLCENIRSLPESESLHHRV